MSKRFDNKRILYILAGLIILLALTIFVRAPRQRATIKEKLVEIDTASVSKIIISPRMNEGAPFEFMKKEGKWVIQQGNITGAPEKDVVQNILGEVMNIKPSSLEARDRSKWKEFSLTDSLAISVKFLNTGGKVVADLLIGKFTYNQAANPYSSPGSNGIQGTSFVRLHDEKNIYGVEGFLALSFSGKFSDYRDKSFLKVNREDVKKVTFTLPADSGFILLSKDNKWYAGEKIADSATVVTYLNGLRYLNGQDFKDNFRPAENPVCQLIVEGNNMLNVTVRCYRGDNPEEYIISSSLNPDVYFSSRRDGIFDRLFKSEKYFFPGPVKKAAKK